MSGALSGTMGPSSFLPTHKYLAGLRFPPAVAPSRIATCIFSDLFSAEIEKNGKLGRCEICRRQKTKLRTIDPTIGNRIL